MLFAMFSALAPSKPVILEMDIGENSVNVSWTPDTNNPPHNPGNMFYLEYRKIGRYCTLIALYNYLLIYFYSGSHTGSPY